MPGFVTIQNQTRPLATPIQARNCTDFWSNFRGLMFSPQIPVNGGALLVEARDSQVNTTIHMLFMRFDIAAIWINLAHQVVDVKIAKRWRLAYAPQNPAAYVLEAHVFQAENFKIGDRVSFTND